MIYNEEYKVKFYINSKTGCSDTYNYIYSLDDKVRTKIFKYIEYLRENDAYLKEPYSKYVGGKIRELRVDFSSNRYRIFYFCIINKKIIILHAFLKKSQKTPKRELRRAI